MPEFTPTTARLIASYRDQAYHKAVEFAVVALRLGDQEGCRMFSTAARELMMLGYHKHEPLEPISGMPESSSPNKPADG